MNILHVQIAFVVHFVGKFVECNWNRELFEDFLFNILGEKLRICCGILYSGQVVKLKVKAPNFKHRLKERSPMPSHITYLLLMSCTFKLLEKFPIQELICFIELANSLKDKILV